VDAAVCDETRGRRVVSLSPFCFLFDFALRVWIALDRFISTSINLEILDVVYRFR
jgi:hypothetical protein